MLSQNDIKSPEQIVFIQSSNLSLHGSIFDRFNIISYLGLILRNINNTLEDVMVFLQLVVFEEPHHQLGDTDQGDHG